MIHILYTGCAKFKKNNSGSKRVTQITTTFVTRFIKEHKINAELIPIRYLRQYGDQVWGLCDWVVPSFWFMQRLLFPSPVH